MYVSFISYIHTYFSYLNGKQKALSLQSTVFIIGFAPLGISAVLIIWLP